MFENDEAWRKWRNEFAELYDSANYSSPLQSWVMHRSHKLAEKYFDEQAHFSSVLEVGAGTGEHLQFVRHSFDKYVLTDLEPKALEVAKTKLNGIYPGKLQFEQQSGDSLSYQDDTFDRLVATHVLEHLFPPVQILQEWYRVIKNGGILSLVIPSDPGLLWRLGRHFGPRKGALARGIAYDYIMAREHVNSCNNLMAILDHHFPGSKQDWWPFRLTSMDLNLFVAIQIKILKQ